MRRAAALWLLLFAAYASTLGLHAFGNSDYAGDEPHYLLAAKSIVDDGDVDVRDEFAVHAYREFYPRPLERHGRLTKGRLNEPHGVGFPLLIAPAFAIGGAKGVELFLAAIAALGVVFAYRLALRVVPDPWALAAAAAVGLSPPFLAYGTAVYPDLTAGAMLAAAALLALRLDAQPSRKAAFVCFGLLSALPWLDTKFVLAGLVVGALGARGLWRARRRTLAIGVVELSLFSVTLFVAISEGIYGGLTPYAAEAGGQSPTGATFPGGYLDRAYRAVALFIDRGYGLLRWAPVLALAFAGLWWLWRSRRDRLARAMPGVRDIELTAGLCALVLAAQLLVAVFGAPTMFGFWFPGRQLLAALPLTIPLVAWGFRHAPRIGLALSALTLGASAWLYLHARVGGGSLVADLPDAPFGPLTRVLPAFNGHGEWPFWLAGAIGVALVALFARELHRSRRMAGAY